MNVPGAGVVVVLLFKMYMKIPKNFCHWQEGFLAYHKWNTPSTTSYWSGLDSEKRYQENPHSSYTPTSITYTYNKYGFRTHEFALDQLDNNILCFGCSVTEGVSVQHPWPELLARSFPNYNVYNLGHAAGSADTVSRLLTNYVPILRPKKVFILWPGPNRFELYHEGMQFVGPWHQSKHLVDLLSEANTSNWMARNKIYVKTYAKSHNFELYDVDMTQIYEDFKSKQYEKLKDEGRDRLHPGPMSQLHFTNRFLQLL